MSSKHERHHEPPPSDSGGLSESQETLAQQPRLYERRPRHKTRVDRYELKHEKQRKKPEKEKKRRARRQPRNAKTGATLLHDFSADNVASERLTVGSVKYLPAGHQTLAYMTMLTSIVETHFQVGFVHQRTGIISS